MGKLKKIESSTLMETVIASVLIMIVFFISSQVINGLMSSRAHSDQNASQFELDETEYLYKNGKLSPGSFSKDEWNIEILPVKGRYGLTEIKVSQMDGRKKPAERKIIYEK